MDINDLEKSLCINDQARKNMDELKEASTSLAEKIKSFSSPLGAMDFVDKNQTYSNALKVDTHMPEFIARASAEAYESKNPVIKIRESIEQHVRQFESALDHDEEIMILAASFGSQVIFYVESIEFNKPSIIIFHGTTPDGKPTRLIQHCNQLNFLLQAANKHNPDEERTPIGFVHN